MRTQASRGIGAALVFAGLLTAQRTIWVDAAHPKCPGSGTQSDPYCAIQTAIQAAANSDTILVMPGVYRENLDFLGKGVRVRSQSGPGDTTIDAGQRGSGVVFKRSEGPKSVLSGFTIRNGTGTLVTIFTVTRLAGGAILCQGASPTIEDMVLEANQAVFGAGVCGVYSASPALSRVVMRGNQAGSNGGGVCFMFDCKPLLVGCVFRANRCNHTGGGLNFRNNSFPVLVNCLFDGNYARDMGGGIRAGALSGCTIVHCSFAGNSSLYGGAVAAGSDTSGQAQTTLIENSILWNNSATWGPELSLNGRYAAIVAIGHSNVRGGVKNVYVQNSTFVLNWGSGMIGADPQWVGPLQGDLHLRATSPCRDRGANVVSHIRKIDFEGDPRIVNTTTDMGADEFHPHVYHSGSATPGGTIAVQILGHPNGLAIGLASPATLDPPVPIPGLTGLLRLAPRGILVLPIRTIPASGFVTWRYAFPKSFPAGDIPSQAVSGLHLTNLDMLRVR